MTFATVLVRMFYFPFFLLFFLSFFSFFFVVVDIVVALIGSNQCTAIMSFVHKQFAVRQHFDQTVETSFFFLVKTGQKANSQINKLIMRLELERARPVRCNSAVEFPFWHDITMTLCIAVSVSYFFFFSFFSFCCFCYNCRDRWPSMEVIHGCAVCIVGSICDHM